MLRQTTLMFILVVEMTEVRPHGDSSTERKPCPRSADWVEEAEDNQCPHTLRDTREAGHAEDTCGPPGAEHLSEEPLQGFHVLKLPYASSGCATVGSASVEVEVYVDGVSSSAPPTMTLPRCDVTGPEVFAALQDIVDTERPGLHHRLAREHRLTYVAVKELRQGAATRPSTDRWRGFFPTGKQLSHRPRDLTDALQQCGTVYVYEGGVFLWPGIRPGYQRAVTVDASDSDQRRVVMRTLSLQPLVFAIDHLLSDTVSDWLIDLGKQHMRMQPKGLMAPRSLAITSVSAQEAVDRKLAEKTQPTLVTDDRATAVEMLVANLTRSPVSHGEPLHVLEYPAGHRYDAHMDSFEDAANYRKKTKILRQLEGGRNRLSTLLAYLHTPESGGGDTLFPRAAGAPFPKSYVCTPDARGMRVTPQRGTGILWYNLRADGEQDRLSLHSGCPPSENGSKWVCNMWTWNKPYN